MLYAFGFDRIGVVAGDLYFVDPDPGPGQEGAEQGVRLEVRIFERRELPGSVYSARPIAVERPIWRRQSYGTNRIRGDGDNPASMASFR